MTLPARYFILPLTIAAALVAACGHDKNTSTGSGSTSGGSSPTAPTPPTEDPPTPPPPPQTCSYALTATPDDFELYGGNGALTIATAAGCKWTLKSDAAWAAIEGPAQGEGPASLKLSVAENDEAPARTATLTVADKTATITQRGQGDCTFSVAPVQSTAPRLPWSGEVAVTTTRGCRWTAASDSSWLRIDTTGGSGSGRVSYQTDFNPQTRYADRREGVIALRWRAPTAGQNARVTQWGSCSVAYYRPPEGLPAGATFASDTLTLTSAAYTRVHMVLQTEPFMGCAWTAETSGDSWLTLNFPQTGQLMGGDGDFYFSIPANPGTESRRATISIDLRTLTIIQQGR